ncbi:hypothetical protein GCM10028803_18700 [Larkinella knui]|uniref:DUF4276 family protein n=1 Tax=Larkinella knui TaxID=2025310 RepID=A0A3P1CUH9_9BACT|nr:hypothetical protein [Larkinella knui]RRB16972.1 hypothetical protein EHT87_01410 [Larkinella knui]
MVKAGFICEGETETIIVRSDAFQSLLNTFGIECIDSVIDASGAGNLLPQNIEDFRQSLIDSGANQIFILTDLDDSTCITLTKQRITERLNQTIIVSVKEVESWFLADSATMSKLLKDSFSFETPESQENPFSFIKKLMLKKTGAGCGSKVNLANKMIRRGFSIENAAQHPNCPSANYFLTKLQSLRP